MHTNIPIEKKRHESVQHQNHLETKGTIILRFLQHDV